MNTDSSPELDGWILGTHGIQGYRVRTATLQSEGW